MPLGFERLNERQQRPNALINFIKPLETKDKAIAENFLQRIAAQCYPVMKKHHISVMALEEYAPNPEFLGRNFNAGEVIQLVLKDRQGRWLSLNFVQMVMMHELAHCKQMNHSRYFWGVRNEYAKQMEGLWQEGYKGEGLWGRGRGLEDGAFVHECAPDTTQIPEHLCGGSYRRRGRKRKRGQQTATYKKDTLSYAERQQRRIARKFGIHGEGAALGEDELVRGGLETMGGGKRSQGKPRVANSKRGRELRASAALARFDAAKQMPSDVQVKLEEDSETESEWEADDHNDSAVIKDSHGHDLIKVCGDEHDNEQEGASQEIMELRRLGTQGGDARSHQTSKGTNKQRHPIDDGETKSEPEDCQQSEVTSKIVTHMAADTGLKPTADNGTKPAKQQVTVKDRKHFGDNEFDQPVIGSKPDGAIDVTSSNSSDPNACPICSLENVPESPTCAACSHVLRPGLMPDHWRCESTHCRELKYINAGDAGRCGLCGAARSQSSKAKGKPENKPMGVTSAEVLRWD